MEVVYAQQHGGDAAGAAAKRRWGPLFTLFMDVYTRVPVELPARRLLLRAGLTALYGATLWLLLVSLAEQGWPVRERHNRQLALVALGLQSTPAIYAIANGMGEIVTAFCIVAHLALFSRRRYVAAALVIWAGVYFKLYPIVFLFPFFVFALYTRDMRRYCVAVAASAAALALASVPIAGWRYGFMYPLTMVGSAASDSDMVPILSKEVFGPVSFLNRAVSGFRVHALDPRTIAVAHAVAPAFSVALIVSTAVAAVAFARLGAAARDDATRRLVLPMFQAVVGFLMFALSLDMSITLLLPIVVSLYSPLWLPSTPAAVVLFAAGALLTGTLVPLSLVLRILPFAWLDRLAGNLPAALIPHEKYLWYEVPMIGMALIVLAFCSGVMALRRRGAHAR